MQGVPKKGALQWSGHTQTDDRPWPDATRAVDRSSKKAEWLVQARRQGSSSALVFSMVQQHVVVQVHVVVCRCIYRYSTVRAGRIAGRAKRATPAGEPGGTVASRRFTWVPRAAGASPWPSCRGRGGGPRARATATTPTPTCRPAAAEAAPRRRAPARAAWPARATCWR
jgi:hypothetical protein